MEGTIEVDLEEFWSFVMKYAPGEGDEIIFGVPRFNSENQVMEIDFASGSDSNPKTWKESPEALKQWGNRD